MFARVGIRRSLLVTAALGLVAAGACVSSVECRDSVDIGAGHECVARGGPAEAVGTAAAAGAVWGAVGCRVNGCRPPYVCDDASGFCEPPHCSEGNPCPPGYDCDYDEGRCE